MTTWCFVLGLPELDEAGNIVGYVGALTDITARKRFEEELRTSQTRLLDAIESIPDAFILFDADERLVLCNSKYREQFSEIGDVLVPGAGLEDLLRAGAERGQMAEAIGNVEEWVKNRLRQYRTAQETFEQELGDGRWVLTSERKTQEGGIVGIRTDITEPKRAEETLRKTTDLLTAVLDHSPAQIYLKEPR